MPTFDRTGAVVEKVCDNGRRWKQVDAKTNLSSDGVTKYSTRLWADGTASCDCPGWTKRVIPIGVDFSKRECTHTNRMPGRKADWLERRNIVEVSGAEMARKALRKDKFNIVGKRDGAFGRTFLLEPLGTLGKSEPANRPPEPIKLQRPSPVGRARPTFDEEV